MKGIMHLKVTFLDYKYHYFHFMSMLFRFIHTKIIILDAARNVKRVLRRNFNYSRTIIIHHEEAHNNLVDEDYGPFFEERPFMAFMMLSSDKSG